MTDNEDPFPEAPSYEELEEMKPSTEEMLQNTDEATQWYNNAVPVAARLFVKAARESEEFRESFVADEQREKVMEMGDGETTIEVDAWREVMKEEVPEHHEKVMTMGLSAFQGGSAENLARGILGNDE